MDKRFQYMADIIAAKDTDDQEKQQLFDELKTVNFMQLKPVLHYQKHLHFEKKDNEQKQISAETAAQQIEEDREQFTSLLQELKEFDSGSVPQIKQAEEHLNYIRARNKKILKHLELQQSKRRKTEEQCRKMNDVLTELRAKRNKMEQKSRSYWLAQKFVNRCKSRNTQSWYTDIFLRQNGLQAIKDEMENTSTELLAEHDTVKESHDAKATQLRSQIQEMNATLAHQKGYTQHDTTNSVLTGADLQEQFTNECEQLSESQQYLYKLKSGIENLVRQIFEHQKRPQRGLQEQDELEHLQQIKNYLTSAIRLSSIVFCQRDGRGQAKRVMLTKSRTRPLRRTTPGIQSERLDTAHSSVHRPTRPNTGYSSTTTTQQQQSPIKLLQKSSSITAGGGLLPILPSLRRVSSGDKISDEQIDKPETTKEQNPACSNQQISDAWLLDKCRFYSNDPIPSLVDSREPGPTKPTSHIIVQNRKPNKLEIVKPTSKYSRKAMGTNLQSLNNIGGRIQLATKRGIGTTLQAPSKAGMCTKLQPPNNAGMVSKLQIPNKQRLESRRLSWNPNKSAALAVNIKSRRSLPSINSLPSNKNTKSPVHSEQSLTQNGSDNRFEVRQGKPRSTQNVRNSPLNGCATVRFPAIKKQHGNVSTKMPAKQARSARPIISPPSYTNHSTETYNSIPILNPYYKHAISELKNSQATASKLLSSLAGTNSDTAMATRRKLTEKQNQDVKIHLGRSLQFIPNIVFEDTEKAKRK